MLSDLYVAQEVMIVQLRYKIYINEYDMAIPNIYLIIKTTHMHK